MKPIIFLFPIIALVLISLLYVRLLKNMFDKKALKRFFLLMVLLSFLLNLIWELAQLTLYKGGEYGIGHIAFCTLGSVADTIMTILLYLIFVFVFRDLLWIKNIRWPKILIIIFIGGICAALSEVRHLALGSWAYAVAMPIIPIAKVGLYPVLQFAFLPLLTYNITFYLANKKWTNNKLHLRHF